MATTPADRESMAEDDMNLTLTATGLRFLCLRRYHRKPLREEQHRLLALSLKGEKTTPVCEDYRTHFGSRYIGIVRAVMTVPGTRFLATIV